MGVIRHEYPCIALGLGFRQENRKPFNKVFTIFIIIEYPSALYSPYHDMMQEAGTIESGYPGHDYKLLLQFHAVKLFDYIGDRIKTLASILNRTLLLFLMTWAYIFDLDKRVMEAEFSDY